MRLLDSAPSVPATSGRVVIDLDEIDHVRLAVGLVQLAEVAPEDPRVLAVRLAVEVMDLRREWRRVQRETSQQLSAGADWRRIAAQHVPFDELERRRARPGPLAAGGAA